MKKIYWLAVIVGMVLTPLAHETATRQRGYTAIGGEFFIMLLFLMMALLVNQMCELIAVINAMEEKEKSQ